MRLSINALQIIAIVWAAISVVVAFVLVISLPGISLPAIPWQSLVLMFFIFLLILTLPADLLLYLWHRLSEPRR